MSLREAMTLLYILCNMGAPHCVGNCVASAQIGDNHYRMMNSITQAKAEETLHHDPRVPPLPAASPVASVNYAAKEFDSLARKKATTAWFVLVAFHLLCAVCADCSTSRALRWDSPGPDVILRRHPFMAAWIPFHSARPDIVRQ